MTVEMPAVLFLFVLIAVYATTLVVIWKFLAEPLIWRAARKAMKRSYMKHGLSETAAMREATRTMREHWDVTW